jgi:hypothetical protein
MKQKEYEQTVYKINLVTPILQIKRTRTHACTKCSHKEAQKNYFNFSVTVLL